MLNGCPPRMTSGPDPVLLRSPHPTSDAEEQGFPSRNSSSFPCLQTSASSVPIFSFSFPPELRGVRGNLLSSRLLPENTTSGASCIHCALLFSNFQLSTLQLVSFLITEIKYPKRSNIRENRFMLAQVWRVESILMTKAWWWEVLTAGTADA